MVTHSHRRSPSGRVSTRGETESVQSPRYDDRHLNHSRGSACCSTRCKNRPQNPVRQKSSSNLPRQWPMAASRIACRPRGLGRTSKVREAMPPRYRPRPWRRCQAIGASCRHRRRDSTYRADRETRSLGATRTRTGLRTTSVSSRRASRRSPSRIDPQCGRPPAHASSLGPKTG